MTVKILEDYKWGEYQYSIWQIVAVSHYYFFLNVHFQYEADIHQRLQSSESGHSAEYIVTLLTKHI